MNRLNKQKVKVLYENIPANGVVTSAWLKSMGISEKLVWWYLKSGWLERVSTKLYKKPGTEVTWPAIVEALQQQLQLPIYIGARTALSLLGKSHFIASSNSAIQLFADQQCSIPSWLKKTEIPNIVVYKTNLFNNDLLSRCKHTTPLELNSSTLLISVPERAIFEVLYLLPKSVTFDECFKLMSSLSGLRIKLVQQLLEACTSVKVKRCFLYLADVSGHEWLSELNLGSVDLGRGDRSVAGGGKYINKYKLTVPILEELNNHDIP